MRISYHCQLPLAVMVTPEAAEKGLNKEDGQGLALMRSKMQQTDLELVISPRKTAGKCVRSHYSV